MARAAIPQQADPGAAQRQVSKLLQFPGWKKMNTKVARQNLPDDQAAWIENLQPIAPNDMKLVPGPAATLFANAASTSNRLWSANINAVDYVITFYFTGANAGTIEATNANTGASVVVGTGFTKPDLTVFASSRLLIMDPVKGYATWDGTLFVGSGGISPNIHITAGGSGYTSAPAISFTGGAGGNAGGATATATIAGGSVVSITLTNPGTGNAAGAAITVVFTGGGFSVVATATVVVWPQVLGNTIDVFAGRVWWASTNASGQFRVLNFTGTGATTGVTYDDLNPSDAAGSTTITDQDLAHSITAIRNLNNYLYIFGDQSVKQIGSINVSSSTTLFTILTLASDIGTPFLMSIRSYNRLVLFANKQGVYGIFGATVQKISDDLDGIFQAINFNQELSSALNDITNIHCYVLLVSYVDPILGQRSLLCLYQTDQWFLVSGVNLANEQLTAITSVPLASSTQVATFGIGLAILSQLLQNQSAALTIKFQTALSPNKNLIQAKAAVRGGVAVTSGTASTFTMSLDTENGSNIYTLQAAAALSWVNNLGQIVQFQNNSLSNVTFIAGGYRFPRADTEGYGKVLGITVQGTVTSFAINSMAIEYVETDMWGDSP
jgi:hypothetical protein